MKSRLFLLMVFSTALCFDVSAQSERKKEKYKRPTDKVVAVCIVPPPDVMTKKNKTEVDAKIPKVVELLKNGGGANLTIDRSKEFERIRGELSDLHQYEVMEYRLCVQYGNGVLSADEYKKGAEEFRPKKKDDLSKLGSMWLGTFNTQKARWVRDGNIVWYQIMNGNNQYSPDTGNFPKGWEYMISSFDGSKLTLQLIRGESHSPVSFDAELKDKRLDGVYLKQENQRPEQGAWGATILEK